MQFIQVVKDCERGDEYILGNWGEGVAGKAMMMMMLMMMMMTMMTMRRRMMVMMNMSICHDKRGT